MRIVIDIPDEMFDWYDNGFPEEDDAEKLWQIVKNGTPLPIGHGIRIASRLVDDVLDKIRAEIEERKHNSCGEPNRELAFNVCLKIVDKYKAESEVQE